MPKTIDNLINAGKKLLTGAALIASLSGITGCGTTTYAKKDYDRYPAHRAEIAFYNINEIAKDVCNIDLSVDDNSFKCKRKYCAYTVQTNPPIQPGQYTSSPVVSCGSYKTETFSFYWDKVRKILPGEDKIKICSEDADCNTIQFKNKRQAADFAEALNIYLRER